MNELEKRKAAVEALKRKVEGFTDHERFCGNPITLEETIKVDKILKRMEKKPSIFKRILNIISNYFYDIL